MKDKTNMRHSAKFRFHCSASSNKSCSRIHKTRSLKHGFCWFPSISQNPISLNLVSQNHNSPNHFAEIYSRKAEDRYKNISQNPGRFCRIPFCRILFRRFLFRRIPFRRILFSRILYRRVCLVSHSSNELLQCVI